MNTYFFCKYAYSETSCDITFKVINFLIRCYTLELIQSQFNLLDQSLCKKLEESNHAETLISLWTDLALCVLIPQIAKTYQNQASNNWSEQKSSKYKKVDGPNIKQVLKQ